MSDFALILGVICYFVGFPLVFSDKKSLAWMKKTMREETVMRFTGLTLIVLSVLVLKEQWKFTPDGDGIVVFLAWVMLIKGVLRAWWPTTYIALRKPMDDLMFGGAGTQMVLGVLFVLIGACFTYLGVMLH